MDILEKHSILGMISFSTVEEPTLVTKLAISSDKVTTGNSFKSFRGSIFRLSMGDRLEAWQ